MRTEIIGKYDPQGATVAKMPNFRTYLRKTVNFGISAHCEKMCLYIYQKQSQCPGFIVITDHLSLILQLQSNIYCPKPSARIHQLAHFSASKRDSNDHLLIKTRGIETSFVMLRPIFSQWAEICKIGRFSQVCPKMRLSKEAL